MRRLGVLVMAVGCTSSSPGGAPAPDGGVHPGVPDAAAPDAAIPPDAMTIDAPPGSPTVIAMSPADGASAVAPDATITATFSEDMDPATITSTSFTVSGVTGTVTYANRVATFTPTARMPLLATATATLSTAITDASGAPLAVPVTWRFGVRDGAWSAPTRLTPPSVSDVQSTPSVAVDAAGDAITVWASQSDAFAERFTPGGGWGAPLTLFTHTNEEVAYGATVGGDAAGDAIAAWWLGTPTGHPLLWASHFTPAGGWDAPVELDVGEAARVAFDGAGNAVLAYQQEPEAVISTAVRWYIAGVGWQDAVVLGVGGYPDLAVDAGGDAVVAWENSAGDIIEASTFQRSTGWSPAATLGSGLLPHVAIDAGGHAVAAWFAIPVDRVARFRGAWEPSEALDGEGLHDWAPDLAFDPAANAYAIFTRELGADVQVVLRRAPSDGDWGTPLVIDSAAGQQMGYDARIGFDPAGNALAIYQDDPTRTLRAAREPTGGSWIATTVIDTSDAGVTYYPALAIAANGIAAAVWDHTDGPPDPEHGNSAPFLLYAAELL